MSACVHRDMKHFFSFLSALQSVKGSGNSAFLQKDQLCYLKRAEKLTFCIYLFASRLGEKLKKAPF